MPGAETQDISELLLEGLSEEAATVVRSSARRLLVVAGAGAGKTEAMARRIAWWHAVDGVEKDHIVAFTFTERAAEEMKFRVRKFMAAVSPDGEDPSLGGMYVGTIHSYCLNQLRALWPQEFHNDEIVDDVARYALVQQGFDWTLGLPKLQKALGANRNYPPSRADTIEYFLRGYDLLNEYNHLDVRLPEGPWPAFGQESEWCKEAVLAESVGNDEVAEAFSMSARSLLRVPPLSALPGLQHLAGRIDPPTGDATRSARATAGLDDAPGHRRGPGRQPGAGRPAAILVGGTRGHLTAVGDHRQAIYGFRGGGWT